MPSVKPLTSGVLPSSDTSDASIAIDVGVSLGGGEKPEVSRATLVFGQENSFPLREGLLCLITPTRLPGLSADRRPVIAGA